MLQDPGRFHAALAELAFAYEQVAFYRTHLENGGVHPREIRSPDDWMHVPPTEKADYRRHFPTGVLARGARLGRPGLLQTRSSGTTGERLTSVIGVETSRRRLENSFGVNADFPVSSMWDYKKRVCVYIPPNCADVDCANPNLAREARLVAPVPGAKPRLTLPVYHDVLTTPEPLLARAANELADYRPHLLIADPNYLAFLTRYMRRTNRPPPALQGILTGYSRATAVARRQISSYFGPATPFAETIGMTEFSFSVAMECRQSTLHLDTASYYAELLVGQRPARRGELGELYLTSLGDTLSPHIRYRTGDFYRLPERDCNCGTPFAAVRFEGRRTNMIVADGRVVLTPSELDDIVGLADWIDAYQVVQTDSAECAFRFIANERYASHASDALQDRISQKVGPGVRVRCERTNYIACERSGKCPTVVALSACAEPHGVGSR